MSPATIYRNPMPSPFRFELSRDSGKTWVEITSSLTGSGRVRNFDFIETGKFDECRIYAQIRLEGESEDFCLYRSEDCGRSFTRLSDQVRYAVESRASRQVLLGTTILRPGLPVSIALSRDGGTHWTRIPSDILFEPLVTNNGLPPVIRTWVENDAKDSYLNNNFPVSQIETDPTDEKTFYIVTVKGLYATYDMGRTFILLPLAAEYISGIEDIVVDPRNSGTLYALVKDTELYRSSDKGCRWIKLDTPKP